MLLAAHAAVGTGGGGMTLTVGGGQPQKLTQTLYLRPTVDQLGHGFTVRNAGTAAVYSGETLIGNPAKDLAAATAGFSLSRQFFPLAGSRSSEQLSWLGDLTKTTYSEYLDDRFVAAVDLDSDNRDFNVAYLVRAVTPGTYRQPAAHIEDMYDPATRARTAIGSVTVRPFK